MAAVLCSSVFAYDFQIGDLCYSILSTSDHTVSVETSSTSLRGDVVIPSVVTYNNINFTVTRIADNGFAYCYNITSFTIPRTITSIGYEGFGWCWYLETIILDNPNPSFSVGSNAFNYDWRAFTTVKIINCDEKELLNNGAAILRSLPTHDMYINGVRITDYKVADGVETINTCFHNCNSIESATIPNSVKKIVDYAFYNCTSLNTITLSSKLESIGYNAFAECPELRTIYSKNSAPAVIDNTTFPNSAYMFATLYVPKGTLSAYKNADGWKNFANIIETEYDDVTDIPQPQKCEIPSISYENGKIMFTCNTDGVEFVSTITDSDVTTHYESEIRLSATYVVNVYAMANGYEDSDVATATLCWLDAEPRTEGLSNDITAVRGQAVMIQNCQGIIQVSGIDEGTSVSVYSVSGVKVGASSAYNGQSSIATNIPRGNVVIVKIGEKSVKIKM